MGLIVFVLVLLAVPVLNLLVGTVVGLGLLQFLVRKGAWLRLLLLLPLAGLWTVFAFLQLAALDGPPPAGNGGTTMWTLKWFLGSAAHVHWGIWGLCATVTAVAIIRIANAGGVANYKSMLAAANALGKGKFSMDNALGEPNVGVMVFVDPDSKHVAVLWKTGFRVEPLSFIRSFEADWDERVNLHSGGSYTENAKVVLEVDDFKTPRYTAFVSTPREAELWVSRLKLLTRAS